MLEWIIAELKMVRWWLVLPIGAALSIPFSFILYIALYN